MVDSRNALALALLALASCSEARDVGSYRLYRHAMRAQRVQVIVDGSAELQRLEFLARELDRRGTWQTEVVATGEADPEALQIWIGGVDSQRVVDAARSAGATVEVGARTIGFAGRDYSGPRDALELTVEDPRREGWPLTVYLASEAAVAAGFVADLAPTWKPGYRTWRDGVIEREGTFDEDGALRPSSASAKLEALASLPSRIAIEPIGEIVVHGEVDASELRDYLARVAEVRGRVERFFGAEREGSSAPTARLHVWPDLESCAFATGSWSLATPGPPGEDVHVALASGLPDDGGLACAKSFAIALFGWPSEDWLLDGVAVECTGEWYGRPLEEWTQHVLAAGFAPRTFELAQPSARASPHVVVPLRGLLARELQERVGADAFLRMWNDGGAAGAFPPDELERRAAGLRGSAGAPPRRERVLSTPFRTGIYLVEPRGSDGRSPSAIGSVDAARSLDELRALGFDAVALAPIGAIHAQLETWTRPRAEPFDVQASDAQWLATIAHARAAGLTVMLVPQLIDSRATTFPSWVANSSEEWDRAFEELGAFLAHYALLAELAGVDVLCLGSEVTQATQSAFQPKELEWTPEYMLHNDLRWHELIARLRPAFGGALSYAAKELFESERLEFWDALDYYGVNLHRTLPVSAGPDPARPSDEELVAALDTRVRQVVAFARRHGKPALLTEVGFAPTTASWHELDTAWGQADPASQAAMLGHFAEALRSSRAVCKDLAGAYFWCWTTDPALRPVERSYSLQNRPAAAVVPRLFH